MTSEAVLDRDSRRFATETSSYIPRIIDGLLTELLADHPAVLIVGPRACGKTTTGRRHSAGRLQLDRPPEAAVARADPDAILAAGPFPLLIDEWQAVPEVLGAVKRAVDERRGSGRFVITGSTQADLTSAGWAATGRLIRAPMYGLTERELAGKSASRPLIDRLLEDGPASLPLPAEVPDIRGYVERALRGGFPDAAMSSSVRAGQRWMSSYIDQLVGRDVTALGSVRDPVRLRRYLQAIAANTGGMPSIKTLIDAAGIDRRTAVAYDSLLESLIVTDQLPAWSGNRLSRLTRLPKRYLIDPAFTGPLLSVDSRVVLRDGDLLGRLLDSFAMAQLRADCVVSEYSPRLFHLRDAEGRHEIDVLAELPDGRIIGIEIKAGAAPVQADARHLLWLRENLARPLPPG